MNVQIRCVRSNHNGFYAYAMLIPESGHTTQLHLYTYIWLKYHIIMKFKILFLERKNGRMAFLLVYIAASVADVLMLTLLNG